MNSYFNTKIIKLKWDYYWHTQLITSSLIFILNPFLCLYIIPYIDYWLYQITKWEVFEMPLFFKAFVLAVLFLIFYTIWGSKKLTKVFKVASYRFGERVSITIFPVLLA